MLVVFNLFSFHYSSFSTTSTLLQLFHFHGDDFKLLELEWGEMEKTEQVNDNQDIPSLLDSSRKPSVADTTITAAVTAGGSGDRLKRDEWSEGAVSTLLDAYESKWVLRNRAKLKGHDWEDVARHVSSRANSTKSHKTQTQCKNKIESMKKRYRSESAATDTSSWPLFPRLDLLLRYRTHPPPTTTATTTAHTDPPLVILDQQPIPIPIPTPTPSLPPPPPQLPPATALPPSGTYQNSQESNGVEPLAKEEAMGEKPFEEGSDKMSMEMDSSTPISDRVKEKLKMKKTKMEKNKKRKIGQRKEAWDIAESIRWLAEVVVRSEQARMETIKEIEKMRAEAEAKRGEMDLKRTEIIANTQLQIAQLLAGNGKGIDSSLRIGRN